MNVFVTGASGFIGSAVVAELIGAGHSVTGLARSEASAEVIRTEGAEVLRGELSDTHILVQGASASDGVVHLGFIHDFSRYEEAAAIDKAAILAMGAVLAGTEKRIVITSGILGVVPGGRIITENDRVEYSARASEAAMFELAANGVNASLVRLPPSVHDTGDKGFVPYIISRAKETGVSAYPFDGTNQWPAVHRRDAAHLFRLALEIGEPGAVYNAIGESGIPVKDIAALIVEKLNIPLQSVSDEAIVGHFGWMSSFIQFNSPATAERTEKKTGWRPRNPGLLDDMKLHYFN